MSVQLAHLQQQKNQFTNFQPVDHTLADVSELDALSPVNSYAIQTNQEAVNRPPVFPSIQILKREVQQNVKLEEVNIKCESDLEVPGDSGEDGILTPGLRRSLPHKKRIAQKLKQQVKKNVKKKSLELDDEQPVAVETNLKVQASTFQCEICENQFTSQLNFFEHLKVQKLVSFYKFRKWFTIVQKYFKIDLKMFAK